MTVSIFSAATSTEEQSSLLSLLQLVIEYGLLSWFLIGMSMFVVTLALERFVTFLIRRSQIVPSPVLHEVDRIVRQKVFDAEARTQLLQVCSSNPSTYSTALARAIDREGMSLQEIESACGQTLRMEWTRLHQLTGYLSLTGRLAPFLGLLGTVVGMMVAFFETAASGAAGSSLLAAAVSAALGTTAIAIIVAVSGLGVAHVAFNTQEKLFNQMKQSLLGFLPLLSGSR